LGRKHIYLSHAQTAIYDSKVKLFLKQGISRQLGLVKEYLFLLFLFFTCIFGYQFFFALQGFQSGPVPGTFTRLRSCDSKVKLFLKQGISRQLGLDAVVRFECENSAIDVIIYFL
jgi:hypothetical protein